MNDRSLFRRPRFLQSTARSLKEACQEVGRDEGGQRCRDCPVRDLCEDEFALAGQAGSAAINPTSLICGRDEPMNQSALVGKRGFGLLAATGAGALAAHLLAARRFRQRTEALARQLGAQVETTLSSAREVPPIVRAFVQRAAAKDGVPVTVHLKQRAEMRLSSGGAWRPLTAAQVIDVHMPGFVWTAGMQLAPCVNASILDAYVDGEGVP